MLPAFSVSFFLTLFVRFLSACQEEAGLRIPTIGRPSTTELTENPGVLLEMTEAAYSTDAAAISISLTNITSEPYDYGADYRLELYHDGRWHQLDAAPSEQDIVVPAVAYILESGESIEKSYSLIRYGAQFDPGRYGIVIEVSPPGGLQYQQTIAAEFTIE